MFVEPSGNWTVSAKSLIISWFAGIAPNPGHRSLKTIYSEPWLRKGVRNQ
jgi:hypothetical protein